MLSLENADKVTHSANSLDQADQAVIVCCHTIAFFFILTFTQAGGRPEVLDVLLSDSLALCIQSCFCSKPQEALKTDSDLPSKLIESHVFIQYSLSSCLAVSMPRGLRIGTLNNVAERIQGFCLGISVKLALQSSRGLLLYLPSFIAVMHAFSHAAMRCVNVSLMLKLCFLLVRIWEDTWLAGKLVNFFQAKQCKGRGK